MNTEIRYRLLKLVESNPNMTQRQMAEEMGLSLGKFNYCLKELVRKGVVKIERFKTSDNKAGYMYLLTPHGIEQKARITASFLKRKMAEYEEIKQQIAELNGELEQINSESDTIWYVLAKPITVYLKPLTLYREWNEQMMTDDFLQKNKQIDD